MNIEKRITFEFEALKKLFPKLTVLGIEKYCYKIKGIIEIIDPYNGEIWDFYEVEILIKNTYPNDVPVLFEKKGKIKRHINKDGSCCLAPRVEEFLILGREYNLCDYVQKLVVPYLAAQKLVDLGEEWPNGEYSHYGDGIIEYYQEKLGTSEIKVILKILYLLTGKVKFGRNAPCFCGSLKKYKLCHEILLYHFNKVNRSVFINDLADIEREITKQN